MSPTRRNAAPRKRPSQTLAVHGESDSGNAESGPAEPATQANADFSGGMDQLLADFEALLRTDPGVDAEGQSTLLEQFKIALDEASQTASADAIDKSVWLETVDNLKKIGGLDENEAIDVTRQVNDALRPLEKHQTKLALELSRRIQTDGEESAFAWFRSQRALDEQSDDAGDQPVQASQVNQAFPSEVVKSRSRRLRGPPQTG